jgi:hypothetical protein
MVFIGEVTNGLFGFGDAIAAGDLEKHLADAG